MAESCCPVPLPLKFSLSLSLTHTHTHTLTHSLTHSCLPFSKSGQFQNIPVRGIVFQGGKNTPRSLWLNIPSVSVQHSWLLSVICAWLGRFRNSQHHHHPCCYVLQLLIQNAPFQPTGPRGEQLAAVSI